MIKIHDTGGMEIFRQMGIPTETAAQIIKNTARNRYHYYQSGNTIAKDRQLNNVRERNYSRRKV